MSKVGLSKKDCEWFNISTLKLKNKAITVESLKIVGAYFRGLFKLYRFGGVLSGIISYL